MVQDKPLRTSWQRKMKERQERKLAKDFARHLEEEKERRRQVRGQLAWLSLELKSWASVCCTRSVGRGKLAQVPGEADLAFPKPEGSRDAGSLATSRSTVWDHVVGKASVMSSSPRDLHKAQGWGGGRSGPLVVGTFSEVGSGSLLRWKRLTDWKAVSRVFLSLSKKWLPHISKVDANTFLQFSP